MSSVTTAQSIIAPWPWPKPNPVATKPTDDYVNVLKEADTTSQFSLGQYQPGLPSTSPDGELSLKELQAYQAKLSQQINLVDMLGNFFSQFLGPQVKDLFKSFSDALKNKQTIAKTMSDNYDKFANPDGVTFIRAPQISEGSIKQLAAKDGDATNVSDFDIKGHRPFPVPWNTTDASGNDLTTMLQKLLEQMTAQQSS